MLYSRFDYTPVFSDRYNPTLCSVASFFIPGLGQIMSNQNRRGVAHLATSLSLGVATGVFTNLGYAWGDDIFLLTAVCTGCILFGWQIWSCVDAGRVAKVMNLYERDLRM